ncbi:MAG: hypothetical protein FWC13_01820 [Oscillospiraceae bacterium]|nr:hypothetical protein [Oscillospiraceae bacterium]
MTQKSSTNKFNSLISQTTDVSDEQIILLSKRLLPEIKRYFADEKIRKEFESWKNNQESEKK